MITVITNHPIAEDSDDHKYPDGIHYDNGFSWLFADNVESYFNRKIDILDLGCAGGGLVTGMINRGHNAVGLEGSDHCLNVNKNLVDKLGTMPLGYENWQTYGNKNLFTCDITYDYEIRNNDQLMQFDLITCFDVMEHFYEERIETFLKMVTKHLKDDGIFFASIALYTLIKDKLVEDGQVEYHKSLFTKEKWIDMLTNHLIQIDFPFSITNRGHDPNFDPHNWYLTFAGRKL